MLRYAPCFLILFAISLLPTQASGDIFSYVDENGVRRFTNAPVSKRYQHFLASGRDGSLKISLPYKSTSFYDGFIKRAARQYQIDPMLIKAVIKTESDFNPRAISSKGARGLMQLMPATASEVNVADPFNPRQNINGGTRYLRKMLDLFNGSIPLSLAAYNAGPTRVTEHGAIPNIPETKKYVRKVMKLYQAYRQRTSSSFSTYSSQAIGKLAAR